MRISTIAAVCRCSVKRGFKGEIITTGATRELARLVMLDSAHLQEEDSQRRSQKLAPQGRAPRAAAPLYTTLDATDSLSQFRPHRGIRTRQSSLARVCAQHGSTPATFSVRQASA